MENIFCTHCQAIQPRDWKSGDLCINCGNAVRGEVRCYWCVQWTPEGKFCRTCGTELVENALFGAARMLKHGGVDKFILPQKLKELPAEQLENLERIYQKHYGLLLQKVEEVKICEKYFVQQHHSLLLMEELIQEIPFDEEQSKNLTTQILKTPEEIFEKSSIASTKILAGLACLRKGSFTDNNVKELYQVAFESLENKETSLSQEGAFVFIHWRIWVEPLSNFEKPSWSKLADIVKPLLENKKTAPWAAMIILQADNENYKLSLENSLDNKLHHEKLRETIKEALLSTNEDLQLSAAISLSDENILKKYLDSKNKEQQSCAAIFLAKQKSRSIAKFLAEANENLLKKLLYILRNPLPLIYIEPLINLTQHQNKTISVTAFRLLEPNFNTNGELPIIEKILALTLQNKNIAVINLLLKGKKINSADYDLVLRSSLQLPFNEELGKIYLSESEIRQLPDYLIDKLAINLDNGSGMKSKKILVKIAGAQLMHFPAPLYKKFIIETIFNAALDLKTTSESKEVESSSEMEVIKEAIWSLIRPKSFFIKDFEDLTFDQKILEYFSLEEFIIKFTKLLKNSDLLREVGIYEWISSFLDSYNLPEEKMSKIHTDVLNDFFSTLSGIIKNDHWLYLRTGAAKLLAKTARINKERELYAIELEQYLKSHHVTFNLEQAANSAIEVLRGKVGEEGEGEGRIKEREGKNGL